MKEIKTPRFWCLVDACGRGFVTLSPLTKHVRTYHADDEEAAEYRRTPLEKIKKPQCEKSSPAAPQQQPRLTNASSIDSATEAAFFGGGDVYDDFDY